MFNLTKCTFERLPDPKGYLSPANQRVTPLPRRNHLSVLIGHHMVVIGGLNDYQNALNDVMSLDLIKQEWACINENKPLTDAPDVPIKMVRKEKVIDNKLMIAYTTKRRHET